MSYDTAYGMPFEKVIKVYEPDMRKAARMVLHNDADVEDAVQETLLKLARNGNKYDPSRSLGPWIYTMAKNTAKDVGRKKRLWEVLGGDMAHYSNKTQNPENGFNAKRDLKTMLECLPLEQRQALELTGIEGFTHVEAADYLGIPLGTLKTRIHSAMVKLRRFCS